MKKIKKKTFERINLYVDSKLYIELKQNAEDTFLPLATYTRQLIQQALKNNIINNYNNVI